MGNALSGETSPYLRQHATNPVDWLPWGEQALEAAVQRDVPLLVSIGYSSCHWCHVMERESFEDERVAALMNERFVCVKVDREERPDVDAIYMEAVQAMTGQGGWPLNVFLTPEQMPFYGGTYFPPQPRQGMPAWSQVLQAVSEAWQDRRTDLRRSAEQLKGRLAGAALLKPSTEPFDEHALELAVLNLAEAFDSRNGGFGGAPKFPQSSAIELLISEAAIGGGDDAVTAGTTAAGTTAAGAAAAGTTKEGPGPGVASSGAAAMALQTLRAIVTGGIHDQLGGGFHRYAVDATWTVPHFEKMLYDNALLARACLRGFKLSGERLLLDACLDTIGWAMREMQGQEGGFLSALDADSEGVEGAYYVWRVDQLSDLLGEDADAAIAWLGASEQGNFVDPHHPVGGLNVLSARGPKPSGEVERRVKETLLAARARRERPGVDDKRLTAWNALMISALAETGSFLRYVPTSGIVPILGEQLLQAADRCADFVLSNLRSDDGRLLRTYSEGQGRLPGYLEDHAFMLEALLSLYEATFEQRRFVQAREIADQTIELFGDEVDGGFFSTASDVKPLVARRKDLDDAPIPAGASSAALGMLRLSALTGQRRYEEHAISTLRLLHTVAPKHPTAFGHLLQALRLQLSPIREVAIAGPEGPARDALVSVVLERPRPDVVLAAGPGDGSGCEVPLLEGRVPVDEAPAAYVCERFSCLRPVTEPERLRELLDDTRAPTGSGRAPSG